MNFASAGLALAVSVERLGIVMEPDGSPVEVDGVLNPGVIRDRHGDLLLFPRVVAAGNVSRIGRARVNGDGSVVREGFALEPEAGYEMRDGAHGCEDPRVTFIAALDRFVMAYTAYGTAGARIAVAVSADARTWTRLGLIRFADVTLNERDNKDAAFFPEVVTSPHGVPSIAFFHRPMRAETVNGQTPISVIRALPAEERESLYLAYIPIAGIGADLHGLLHPTESTQVLAVGDGWGNLKNGAGTPPLRTRWGWLSVFHGVDAREDAGRTSLYYAAGVMINDVEQPHRVLYRSPEPLFVPATRAERFGTVNDVVFPTGLDPAGSHAIDVYYGAADTKIARVRITFDKPFADA
jgi:predicted GH43/DUF377 family glycosyl hydrolase